MTGALQRKIFVGCKQLGLDTDARHDLQLAVTGKASLSDMTDAEKQMVLNRLKQAGFNPAPRKKGARNKQAPRSDLRLIHVLWKALGETGALRDPTRRGLNAFIRSRFETAWQTVPADVDMLREWHQIDDVIQALKAWAARENADFDFGEHRK